MDELIKLVAVKVGIPEDQARQAVEVVLGFLKKQLPEPFASQIDAVVGGDMSGMGDMLGGLSGLFGTR